MKHFLLQRILLFANLRDNFCFRIRHNSHTQPFVHPFLLLFIKLDNYGEFRSKVGLQIKLSLSGWGLQRGGNFGRKRSMGVKVQNGPRIFPRIYSEARRRSRSKSVYQRLLTLQAPRISSFSRSVVSAEGKLQALTAGQAVAVRGPYTPQRVLKPHGVTGAVPS